MSRRKSPVAEITASEPQSSVTTEASVPPPTDEPKQYAPGPNPRAWDTNSEAGVEYRTRTKPYEAQIAFKEKPSPEVIDYIKQQGFHWNDQDRVWARSIGFSTQEQDRLLGRRAYAEVVAILRKEKGISSEAEVAF